jgi:hypothetical protein
MTVDGHDELARLSAENAWPIRPLSAYGTVWRVPQPAAVPLMTTDEERRALSPPDVELTPAQPSGVGLPHPGRRRQRQSKLRNGEDGTA